MLFISQHVKKKRIEKITLSNCGTISLNNYIWKFFPLLHQDLETDGKEGPVIAVANGNIS